MAQAVPEPKKGGTVGDRILASAVLNGTPEQRTRGARHAAVRNRRAGLGLGLQPVPPAPRHRRRSTSASAARASTASTTRSTTRSRTSSASWIPTTPTAWRWRKVGGRTVLRLADADLLPFEFTRAAARIKSYAADVQKLADTMRTETTEHNRRIDDGVFALAANPADKLAAPKKRTPVPAFDFAPLTNAVERLTVAARRYDARPAPAWRPAAPVRRWRRRTASC